MSQQRKKYFYRKSETVRNCGRVSCINGCGKKNEKKYKKNQKNFHEEKKRVNKKYNHSYQIRII